MNIDDYQPQDVLWCDVCRNHKTNTCDSCGEPFNQERIPHRSQSFHYHPSYVDGTPGSYAIHKQLCRACYIIDHENVYGAGSCPEHIKYPAI